MGGWLSPSPATPTGTLSPLSAAGASPCEATARPSVEVTGGGTQPCLSVSRVRISFWASRDCTFLLISPACSPKPKLVLFFLFAPTTLRRTQIFFPFIYASLHTKEMSQGLGNAVSIGMVCTFSHCLLQSINPHSLHSLEVRNLVADTDYQRGLILFFLEM